MMTMIIMMMMVIDNNDDDDESLSNMKALNAPTIPTPTYLGVVFHFVQLPELSLFVEVVRG